MAFVDFRSSMNELVDNRYEILKGYKKGLTSGFFTDHGRPFNRPSETACVGY
jgi:hypothetical protein